MNCCYNHKQSLPLFINITMQAHVRNPETITATVIRINCCLWFLLLLTLTSSDKCNTQVINHQLFVQLVVELK